tara:strand:+ start:137 stop:541 length:405 start_codon:yes stop_codon:yes gene_type:complete
MSLRRRSLDEERSESINVSPLIDVVFILLIFFIVSATFVSVPGVEVKRPEARTAKSLQKNSVLFALSEKDEIFHAGKRVSLEEIPRLIEIASKNRPKPVVIQVDKWADASLMSEVVAKARRSAPSISIATRKSR